MKYVALLRGINVGGKNKLAMKDLALIVAATGCDSVETFIQSGNVVFGATPKVAKSAAKLIEEGIRQRFDLAVPVVVRSVEQLNLAARANPFLNSGGSEEFCHLMFLADQPDPGLVRQLDPDRSPPDRFIVRGNDIYLYLPNGSARTKLSNAYFDSKLKTVSTGRNWRTVCKLVELVSR